MSKYNNYTCNRCLSEFTTSWPCKTDYGIICDECIEEYAYSSDNCTEKSGGFYIDKRSKKKVTCERTIDEESNDSGSNNQFIW